MNVLTGLSILNKPWLVEPNAAIQLLDCWERVKSGELKWDWQAARKDESGISAYKINKEFFAIENVVFCPQSTYDMDEFKGFDGASVAVIPVCGPLMKNDFCGSFGTASMANMVQMASNTDSVHTIILAIDTPGGTVDGTQRLSQVVKDSPKRTIALVDGLMCSAGYWAGCGADEIYATSATDKIGSIGTMCSFYDYSKSMADRGIVLREYYATASVDKNRAGIDAANGDGKKLVQEMLDPINDIFMSSVKENRGGKMDLARENVLTGKVYTAAAAANYGLIDGIKSFENTIKEAMQTGPTPGKALTKLSINSKIPNMEIKTIADLKAAHPVQYAEAKAKHLKAGADAEKTRVRGWLAWAATDPEAVAKGIAGDAFVDSAVISEMSAKAAMKAGLKNAETAAPEATNFPEQQPDQPKAAAQIETENFSKDLMAEMTKRIKLM